MELCQGPRVSTENTYLQQYIISVRTFLIPFVLFYDVIFSLILSLAGTSSLAGVLSEGTYISYYFMILIVFFRYLGQGPRVSPEFCQGPRVSTENTYLL